MSWFKKFKKSRQPSQQPVPSSGIRDTVTHTTASPTSSSATPNPDVSSKDPREFDLRSLTAVLDAISNIQENGEEMAVAKDQARGLSSRVAALDGIFIRPPHDAKEGNRRIGLLHQSMIVEAELRSFYEQATAKQLADYAEYAKDASEFIEGLERAIDIYEIERQNDRGREIADKANFTAINSIRIAERAEYRHASCRKGCLKATRKAVLDEIELWTKDFDKPPIYWLNGLAGTGKSAIAQTISERVSADRRLGASFFCSRDFKDRSDLKRIFPTIAVQLAQKCATFRAMLALRVRSNPGVIYESLQSQMNKLIIRPLKQSAISTVIVIDALDECEELEIVSTILPVLGKLVSEVPRVKLFITSRPEREIQGGFRLPLLAGATEVFILHNVEASVVNSDIRIFLEKRLLELALRNRLDFRPTKEHLDLLCERAAGLFVYAMATVNFIGGYGAKLRLDYIMQSPENTGYEGGTKINSDTTLDSLYMSILQRAFGDEFPEDYPLIRSVLGALVLAANPLPPSAISALSGIDPISVFLQLSSIHSVLVLQDENSPVRPFHKSFSDFIVDPIRCPDKRFHLSLSSHHQELLVSCLELMNQTLEGNMCKLPDTVTNSEVDDLDERVERYISPALRYACKSWYKHIDKDMARTPAITSALHCFLKKKFLFWLEVLSIIGAVREAVDALQAARKWLEASPTLDLVKDCFSFVTEFFDIISTSSPDIYHSALPLSPRTSIVWKLYGRHAHPLTGAT